MKRFLLLMLLTLRAGDLHAAPPVRTDDPAPRTPVTGMPAEFGLTRSDLSGCEIAYSVPDIAFAEDTIGARRYLRPSLPGALNRGRVGEPALPARILRVAVPFGSQVSVQVQAFGGARNIEGVPMPQPEPVMEEVLGVRRLAGERRVANPAAYSRDRFEPGVLGRLSRIYELRNQRVAEIELYPLQASPATGLMRAYSRIEVRVSWIGGEIHAAGAEDGPFEAVYERSVLNYTVARSFRRERTPAAFPNPVTGSNFFATSHGPWVRMHLTRQGMYQVTPADLQARAGLSAAELSAVDVSQLRVFTGATAGLPERESGDCDTCFLREVDCELTDASGNPKSAGNFVVGDKVVFYATATQGFPEEFWPDTLGDSSTSEYLRNEFTDDNVYWITWGEGAWGASNPPHRMGRTPSLDTPATTFAEAPVRVHLESDNIYDPDNFAPFLEPDFRWEKWFWEKYANAANGFAAGQFRLPASAFALPGADSTRPAELMARLWGSRISFKHQVEISDRNGSLGTALWESYGRLDFRRPFVPSENRNQFTLTVPATPGRSDVYYLAFLEVLYTRRLEAKDGRLFFRAPATSGSVGYELGGFSALRHVYAIRDFATVSRVTGGSAGGFGESLDGGRAYMVVEPDSILRPLRMERAFQGSPSYLHDLRRGADDVIVSYDGFLPVAGQLADWRSQHLLGIASPRVTVAGVQSIYDEFSGGRFDPTAIRNFARYAFRNWSGPSLSYLTLLGDCSNDFKDRSRRSPNGDGITNFVPMFESSYDSQLGVQYGTDDWFARLGPDQGMAFAIGRIPAADLQQARLMVVDKTIAYEQNPEFGKWRRRVLLGADDQHTCQDRDDLGYLHTQQMARMSRLYFAPTVERRHAFMVDYDFSSTGNSCYKPGAEHDFLEGLNQGALVSVYIGHGNPVTLATEKLFSTQDLGSLHNGRRLVWFLTASCTVGKVDSPDQDGLAESVFKLPGGGSVASLSATQEAIAYESVPMCDSVLAHVADLSTGAIRSAIGVAVLAGKFNSADPVNNAKYVLQGDPALFLGLPKYGMEVTGPARVAQGGRVTAHVRVKRFDTGELVPLSGVDSVDVLEPPTIKLVRATGGADCRSADRNYDGYYYDCFEDSTYEVPAGTIYRGTGTLRNGEGELSFYLPASSRRGPNTRIRAYAFGNVGDAGGVFSFETVVGTPDTTPDAPTLQVAFEGDPANIQAGTRVRITAHSPHGIYLGTQATNSLYLVLDDGRRIPLSPSFHYRADTDTEGTAEFVLPALDPGTHTLLVSGASNLATAVDKGRHRSQVTTRFAVSGGGSPDVQKVFNFPNPVRSGETDLYFDFKDEGQGTVRIYTVSGTRLRTLRASVSPGTNRVHWDLKDEAGDTVSNGTYVFQVEVKNPFGQVARALGKLVILRN